MSYSNPQIIVDRSAEIFAEGISKLGQKIVGGFEKLAENRRKEKEKSEKIEQANTLLKNDIDSKFYDDQFNTTEKIRETKSSNVDRHINILEKNGETHVNLLKDFKVKESNGTLSNEDRVAKRKALYEYPKKKKAVVAMIGNMGADLELAPGASMGNPDSDYVYAGGSAKEKFANNLTLINWGGGKPEGIKFSEPSDISDEEWGVKAEIDTNDPSVKKYIEMGLIDLEDYKDDINEDGIITINNRGLVSEYKSLLTAVDEKIDDTEYLQDNGYTNSKNDIQDKAFTTKTYYRESKGSVGSETGSIEYLDANKIKSDKNFLGSFVGDAAAFVAKPIGSQLAYVNSRFGNSGITMKEWKKITDKDKQTFFINESVEDSIEKMQNSLESRDATEQEIKDGLAGSDGRMYFRKEDKFKAAPEKENMKLSAYEQANLDSLVSNLTGYNYSNITGLGNVLEVESSEDGILFVKLGSPKNEKNISMSYNLKDRSGVVGLAEQLYPKVSDDKSKIAFINAIMNSDAYSAESDRKPILEVGSISGDGIFE